MLEQMENRLLSQCLIHDEYLCIYVHKYSSNNKGFARPVKRKTKKSITHMNPSTAKSTPQQVYAAVRHHLSGKGAYSRS